MLIPLRQFCKSARENRQSQRSRGHATALLIATLKTPSACDAGDMGARQDVARKLLGRADAYARRAPRLDLRQGDRRLPAGPKDPSGPRNESSPRMPADTPNRAQASPGQQARVECSSSRSTERGSIQGR
jgi:hypothetical protein